MAHTNFPVDIIFEDWKSSYQLRFEDIQNNMSNPEAVFYLWPHYTSNSGIVLVRK